MSSDTNDPLQSLIAEILEAENRGESVDREALLEAHPELSDSLHEFFANHDRMKSAAAIDPPTLPPVSDDLLDDPTIPPQASSDKHATTPVAISPDDEGVPAVGDQVRYFGDYELVEEIARGGMGVVFKARQMNLNRTVALKMILAGQFAGEEDVQRFYTEAEAAAQLDHPGIVPIFEIGEHQGQHYFSMGYIEGESLGQKVADGPLPPREAAELVKKICEAMAYAHERGVIHRDLKPANILIDRSGQPKVTDFGLAKKTEADSDLTGTGQILGTPAYMPPEQAAGKSDQVGPLADVYSLGAILYCLLTGRPPFQAASPMDTLLQVLEQEPVAPRKLIATLPRDLDTIALKCLDKDPASRYHSASELAADLNHFLRDEPIAARPIGPIATTVKWARRSPIAAAFWAAVIWGLVLMCFALMGYVSGISSAMFGSMIGIAAGSILGAAIGTIVVPLETAYLGARSGAKFGVIYGVAAGATLGPIADVLDEFVLPRPLLLGGASLVPIIAAMIGSLYGARRAGVNKIRFGLVASAVAVASIAVLVFGVFLAWVVDSGSSLTTNSIVSVTRSLGRAERLRKSGEVKEAQGLYGTAIQELEQAAAASSPWARQQLLIAYSGLASMEGASLDADAAQSTWQKTIGLVTAIDEQERTVADWGFLGQAHYRLDNWREAEASLRKCIDLERTPRESGDSRQQAPVGYRFWYVMALQRLGETEKARKYYDQFVVDSDFSATNDQLRARLEAAELLNQQSPEND